MACDLESVERRGKMNSPATSAGETKFSVKRLTIAVPSVREFQRS
jgi:hypothetical protein